ncbi:MAG TPA: DUF3187 family protein [Planctomycetota bacterium]|nr:DUF3187 family protein [Planctomycetota bacterium]
MAFAGGCLGLLAASSGCVARPRLDGPLPVRNQHPAQLTVFHMAPAAATTRPAGTVSGRLDFAYSNMFLSGSDADGDSWIMDGEYLRVGTTLGLGLGAGFDLQAEVPVAHTTGGFLDSAVIDYHDAFGLPGQSRKMTARNAYSITASKDGAVAWSVDRSDIELMDIPLQLSWQMRPPGEGRLGVAWRGGIELPTGNDEHGFGNGEVDYGLGVVLDYRFAGIGCYAHAQHTFAGTPDQSKGAGLEFADVTSLGLASELPLSAALNAFVQFEWETSTLREIDLHEVTRDQLLLWVGGRLRVAEHWGIEFGIGEDLQGLVSPDFTLWLGGTWMPGAPGP